ncbi:TlyA family RNA methyltransferase [Brachybacterium sp. DNPG3]
MSDRSGGARRLDLALAEEGLARSRTHARRIVEEGRARVDGRTVSKPSAMVPAGAGLEVVDVPDGVEYASRAAHKLISALDAFDVDPAGLRCLDAGASTGGFTDVLLRRGAAHVIAVDIGHDQLAAHVRDDPRVEVRDGISVRDLDVDLVGGSVDLLVSDLSFISLRTVVAPLGSAVRRGGELLLMVKPQFEVGRKALPRTGVVADPRARRDAVVGVAEAAAEAGLRMLGVRASGLPGQDGNREFFLRLRAEGTACRVDASSYDMIGAVAEESAADAARPPAGQHAGPEEETRG